MALIDIVQTAAAIIGLPQPASVIGSAAPTVVTMKALLDREGRNLAKRKSLYGGGWTILETEHTFQTVADQEEYDLPADLYSVIGNSVWDRGNFFPVRGGISPQEWQAIRSGLVQSAQLRRRYRIKDSLGAGRRRKFVLDPVPSDVETVVFEYVSSRWVSDAGGTVFFDRFQSDDDVSLLPQELLEMGLVWRYKQAKGFDFTADLAEWQMECNKTFGSDTGPRKIPIARNKFTLPVGNVPDSGFGPAQP